MAKYSKSLTIKEVSYIYKFINKNQSNSKTHNFQQNKKIESRSTSTRQNDETKIEFRNTEFEYRAV